jgi:hypothetical protein
VKKLKTLEILFCKPLIASMRILNFLAPKPIFSQLQRAIPASLNCGGPLVSRSRPNS